MPMKIDKLTTNNQPADWLQMITNECFDYPIAQLTELNSYSVIIDCGCNVGGFFNAFKSSFKNWTCIDASSYNIEQFRLNHPNFTGLLIQKALTKNTGEIVRLKKYTDENLNDTPSGNFGIVDFVNVNNNHGWKDNVYEEVESLSFESLLDIVGGKVDLLKVDIEGSEYEFLMGKDLSNVKYVVMELHNFLGDKKAELCQWMSKTHNEVFTIGDGIDSHYLKAFKLK